MSGVEEALRLLGQIVFERDEALLVLDDARRQVTDLAAKVLRLDNDLIDARRQIETLEDKLAEARAGRARQWDGVSGPAD